ncbi:MAG: sodium:calcium antiporter [Nanoarchaeota archaeon]|nr:sodium:calcium antiporter [Nanoarchaeota archaeon]MCK5630407.1 sodium:calcium antiporter [Nanoarchaeota archaeon]
MLIPNLILFLIACLVLVTSGTLLVKSLTKLATYLRVSEFIIGFMILAFATSIPELFVGINAAIAKNTSLALGMVIGSNIANLTIIMGIAILLKRGISIESKKTKTDSLYMFAIAILPFALMWIGNSISRIDGIILICAFLVYARKLYKERTVFTKELKNHQKRLAPILNTLLFVASLTLLFLASKYVIHYAELLSLDLALPPIIMGLFLIALGTSLPELVAGARAVMMGHTEMALGNIIGSVIVNSTLVLGVTALIFPITSEFLLFFTSGIFMLLVTFLFATFVESGNRLYIKEGIALIFFYVFFIIIEFYVKGM